MKRPNVFLLVSIILLSCAENGQQGKVPAVGVSNTSVNVDTAETFATFNERFHNDPAFQISRIAFPIDGNYMMGKAAVNGQPKIGRH